MSTKHLNRNARDRRFAGSLAGLGKSRLETLEQLYLSQIKIIGKGLITPPCPCVSYRTGEIICSSRARRDFPYWARVSEFAPSCSFLFKCFGFLRFMPQEFL